MKIVFENHPKQSDIQTLNQGIAKHAKQKKGLGIVEFFAFSIRGEDSLIHGGCSGNELYGCLYIDQLWVEEPLRNKGYGKKLMLAAESFGKETGCTFSTVNTMDWEALDFYKNLGYYVEFERHGFLKNSIFYFLRKDF